MDARDLSEVLELCRGHIEAIHNLLFLLAKEVEPQSIAESHLNQVRMHLNGLTDALRHRP